MNALIIEDEQLASQRLEILLRQLDPAIRIVDTLRTVSDSVSYLTGSGQPFDFMLLDIQLADGPAFDIFKWVQPTAPVIFTTAYDQYALEAFRLLSIDYLLKPVTLGDLARAIGKIRQIRRLPALPDYAISAQVITALGEGTTQKKYKARFLCKNGQKLQVVSAAEVAFFSAEGHIVKLITQDNTRYLIDQTLEELERQLEPAQFFRVNRNTILHAAAIGAVKPYLNHRLRIALKSTNTDSDIVVSRERVTEFKKWLDA